VPRNPPVRPGKGAQAPCGSQVPPPGVWGLRFNVLGFKV
jgi:hypothetical protein